MQCFDQRQRVFRAGIRLCFVHRVQQSAVGSDHEYGADNALAHLPVKLLLLPYAVVFFALSSGSDNSTNGSAFFSANF